MRKEDTSFADAYMQIMADVELGKNLQEHLAAVNEGITHWEGLVEECARQGYDPYPVIYLKNKLVVLKDDILTAIETGVCKTDLSRGGLDPLKHFY